MTPEVAHVHPCVCVCLRAAGSGLVPLLYQEAPHAGAMPSAELIYRKTFDAQQIDEGILPVLTAEIFTFGETLGDFGASLGADLVSQCVLLTIRKVCDSETLSSDELDEMSSQWTKVYQWQRDTE